MRSVGVFGGTFDPIHIGHLILAEEAWFKLKVIYLVPAADPPHKRNRKLSPAEHRVRMLELAIQGIDYLHVSSSRGCRSSWAPLHVGYGAHFA